MPHIKGLEDFMRGSLVQESFLETGLVQGGVGVQLGA